jgi:NitT/TauT family transport system substrate-binding protein
MISLGLLLSLCLIGCSRPVPSGHAQIRIAVGGAALLIYSPPVLAQVLGYTAEENIEVSLIDFPGGSKALEAMLGGSADVVSGFYDHTVQMAAQGRDLRAFVTMLRYPGLVLVAVSPDVRRVEDLKGRIVGVSAPGSSTHLMLNYLLVKHGLKTADVSVASIGMAATAVAAATRPTVDAAVMTDPSLAMAMKRSPAIRIMFDTRTSAGVREVFGVESYPASVLYSSSAWLDAHHDEAARLARAVRKTLDWMRTHSPEEILEKLPAGFKTDDRETNLAGVRALQDMLSRDGKMDPAAPEVVRKVLATSLDAVRTADIDLAKTYTNDLGY